METLVKPIFLLADSQLLFWRTERGPFLERVRQALDAAPDQEIRAAYIGASNGDAREFYDLFVAAMDGIAVQRCRMIPTVPSEDDLAFLNEAEIILLAGGDIERGWSAFKASGLDQQLLVRYASGAVLLGVSAGAVQLGAKGWRDGDDGAIELFDTLRLVPYAIDVHAESTWGHLQRVVRKSGEEARGIGIPAGGGAIFHHDWTLEPVRHPITEFTRDEQGITQSLLMPPDPDTPFEARPLRRLAPGADMASLQEFISYPEDDEGGRANGEDE